MQLGLMYFIQKYSGVIFGESSWMILIQFKTPNKLDNYNLLSQPFFCLSYFLMSFELLDLDSCLNN